MPITFVELKKEGIDSDESFKTARGIADKLRHFLDQGNVQDEIREKDLCGAPAK